MKIKPAGPMPQEQIRSERTIIRALQTAFGMAEGNGDHRGPIRWDHFQSVHLALGWAIGETLPLSRLLVAKIPVLEQHQEQLHGGRGMTRRTAPQIRQELTKLEALKSKRWHEGAFVIFAQAAYGADALRWALGEPYLGEPGRTYRCPWAAVATGLYDKARMDRIAVRAAVVSGRVGRAASAPRRDAAQA